MTPVEDVKVYLEQRVEALEKKVAELTEALDNMKHSITLTSPDGKKTIALSAMDYCSGIWISGEKGEPMVAIYNEKHQGAVVGIWGKADDEGYRRAALDVALSYTPNKGASIQMFDANNKVYNLTPEETGNGVQMTHRNKF